MSWLLSGKQQEFSHPVQSLALTVDEVINVRRVLVKAEMEKFLQKKELYNNLRKGKVTCRTCHGCCHPSFVDSNWSVCACRFAAAVKPSSLSSHGLPPACCVKGNKCVLLSRKILFFR